MQKTLQRHQTHDAIATFKRTAGNFGLETTGQPAAGADALARESFARMAESGRIVCEYSGFLPAAQLTARHILRCEHLRQLPGEGFPPYRVEPQLTHQIWIWSRKVAQKPVSASQAAPVEPSPQPLELIFRGQFEFALPGQVADELAASVTDFLAFLLLQATDIHQVLRHSESDLFWTDAVASYLEDYRSTLA
jgi:hypothetical protein